MVIFGISMENRYENDVNIGIYGSIDNKVYKQIVTDFESQKNVKLKIYGDNKNFQNDLENGNLTLGLSISEEKLSLFADSERALWSKFLQSTVEVAALKAYGISPPAVHIVSIETRNKSYFDFFFPGILIFSIMQVGLSGGIMLLVQRTKGSLKRLQITPLRKWEFLLGYVSCYLCIMIIQVLGYCGIANLFFDYSFYGSLTNVITLLFGSSVLFILLGILLCNACNTVENGNNFNRFFVFPASFICGVFIPLSSLPEIVQKIAWFHPLTYLVEVTRKVANYNEALLNFQLYILGYIIMTSIIAYFSIKTFKWKENN
jgi:ABC-type multidrug transport system permease subunit